MSQDSEYQICNITADRLVNVAVIQTKNCTPTRRNKDVVVSLAGESAWIRRVGAHALFLNAKLVSKLVLLLLFLCVSTIIPMLEFKR